MSYNPFLLILSLSLSPIPFASRYLPLLVSLSASDLEVAFIYITCSSFSFLTLSDLSRSCLAISAACNHDEIRSSYICSESLVYGLHYNKCYCKIELHRSS